MRNITQTMLIVVGNVWLMGTGCSGEQVSARPPEQPISGPGGRDTVSKGAKRIEFGSGATAYDLFLPQNPVPKLAPVVIFTHGWNAPGPQVYGAWIEHLVKHEGAIVIYPHFQVSARTPLRQFVENAELAIKDGMQRLRSGSLGIRVDESKAAYVGHSIGGLLAADLAAVAGRDGLPAPRAVFCVEPGRSLVLPFQDLRQIPRGTLLLTLAGDDDPLAGTADAIAIYNRSTQIPEGDKDFVFMSSDSHGTPALKASHFMPIAASTLSSRFQQAQGDDSRGGPLRQRLRERVGEQGAPSVAQNGSAAGDAFDFFGTWKLADALCEAAWYGKNREYALGNTPQQRFMGKWSDGVAVKELKVSDPK